MSAFKKVWRYIRRYKKLLVVTITSMLICQLLLLLSPLIVREILDNHLVGIENPWYQTTQVDDNTVSFNGENYKQEKYFEDEVLGKEVTIFQYKGTYYFYDGVIGEGIKKVEGTTLFLNDVFVDNNLLILENSNIKDFYQPSITPLMILIILLFIRIVLSIIFTYIQRLSTAMININITRDARNDAVKALQSLPISYYESEPAGKIANRIIGDVGGLMMLFSTFINLVLNATMSVIFAYVGMFMLNAKFALLTFLAFPIIFIWMKFFTKTLNKIAVKVNDLFSLITASVNEIINGISILQIFNYKKQTAKTFDELSSEFKDEQLKEVKLHIIFGWNMINLLRGTITAIVILYFGLGDLNILSISVTAGGIYVFNEYIIRLIEPLSLLFRQVSGLEHAKVKTNRLFKIIDGEKEDDTIQDIPRSKGKIEFKDVWFKYPTGGYVLKGVSLDINPNQMIGIVGHTGSGKSTLMSVLLRFYDLNPNDVGEVLLDGESIDKYPKRTYRKNVGIILQEPVMFSGTIADNIRFGLDEVSDELIEKTIRDIGGGKLLDKFENGINHDISRSGGNLSVGEKQILSFARAIVHDKPILIMDEATANIDTETETMIQKCLDVVKKDRTLIIIAHRLSTIINADKIVVMENGLKKEEGPHEDLLALDGVYANIYRSQVKSVH